MGRHLVDLSGDECRARLETAVRSPRSWPAGARPPRIQMRPEQLTGR